MTSFRGVALRWSALVLLLAAGCSGGGGASVSIDSPEDGATVQSPVQVQVAADGFTVEPAGEAREGAGHLHLMVDTGCLAPGETIPEDESHRHFADGTTQTELDLPAGEHTLCLQAGDGVHTALDLTDEITVTVAADGGGSATDTETEEEAAGAEEWTGELAGTTVIRGGACEYELEGTFRITVDASRRATMRGTDSFGGTCVGQSVLGSSRDFVASGKRTPSGFQFDNLLLIGSGLIPSVEIVVGPDGDAGRGRYEGPSGEGTATTALTLSIECQRGC